MGHLSNLKIYLCGQVEVDIYCAQWRNRMTRALHQVEPSLIIWDPLIKPQWVTPESRNDSIALDKRVYVDPASTIDTWEANKEIRRVCKALVGGCDIVVARISKQFTWGSIDELEIACDRGIPIFVCYPDGPFGLYGLTGLVSGPEMIREYIYSDEVELVAKLAGINGGTDDLPKRDPYRWLALSYPNAVNHVPTTIEA